jgi:hypothetical protein
MTAYKSAPRYFPSCFTKLGCSLLAITFITAQAHGALLLQYNFSEGTGTTSANSGTVAGADATFTSPAVFSAANVDPSGSGFSMDNSASSMAGNGGRATVTHSSLGGSLDNLTNMTITGWYLADANLVTFARLVNKANNGIGNGEFALYVQSPNILTLQLGSTSYSVGNNLYNNTGQWVFFAVTFTGGSGGTFYGGNLNTSATQTGTYNTTLANIGTNTQNLIFGNRPDGTRAFDGFLDDFRIYNQTLTAAEIEAVRLAAIPEPSTFGLLVLGTVTLVWLRRRMGA